MAWISRSGNNNLTYLGHLVRGELGPSSIFEIARSTKSSPASCPRRSSSGGLSLGVALCAGLPLGVFAAVRRNSWVDYLCSAAGLVGICVPTFVLGPMLAWCSASTSTGSTFRAGTIRVTGCSLRSPSLRLCRLPYATYPRGMLEVLNLDYIRTARAKGAGEARIIFRHACGEDCLRWFRFSGPPSRAS